jgi:hypothetical protein
VTTCTSDKTHVYIRASLSPRKCRTDQTVSISHETDYLRLFTNPSFCYSLVVGRIADCSDAPALLKSYHMPAVALSVYSRSPGLFSSAENCVSHGNPTLWSHVRCRTQHHESCQLYYRLPMCTSATNAISCAVPFFTR